jgi:hypothetical protein
MGGLRDIDPMGNAWIEGGDQAFDGAARAAVPAQRGTAQRPCQRPVGMKVPLGRRRNCEALGSAFAIEPDEMMQPTARAFNGLEADAFVEAIAAHEAVGGARVAG